MAENDEIDNENDIQNNGNSGKGLRAQLEQALAKLANLEQENGELKTRTRTTDLGQFLKSAGARAGADKLYPKDAEVSEEAVKKWVEENAVFVRDEGTGDSGADELQVPEETRANTQRLAALADSAVQRPAGDMSNLLEQIKTAQTPAELSAIYAQVGLRRE